LFSETGQLFRERFYFLCSLLRSEICCCVTQNFHEAFRGAEFGRDEAVSARNLFWIGAAAS
jgi:hypothetical protein